MQPRTGRKLLVAALVALHAAVMLCGPSLHSLPGWGHESGLGCAETAGHVRLPIDASLLQADDCPICHFFSQSTLPVAAVSALDLLAVSSPLLDPPAAAIDHSRPVSASPRAPPAGTLA